jgi:thioredoxin-like negative regulator of GroEL
MDRYDLAIEYSHSALKLEPAFLPVYEVLCKAYIGELDLRNAILTLENALLMEEDETMLYYLAYLYEFQNTQKARQTYKKLIDKYNNEDALKHLINLNRLVDAEGIDTAESIDVMNILQKFWQAEPDNYYVSLELISAWFKHNQINNFFDNIEIFDKNLTASELENIYNYLLTRFINSEELPPNISLLLDKIDFRFNNAVMLNMNAGRVAIMFGDTAKAFVLFEKVMLSKESNDEMKYICIWYYYNNGYIEKAKEIVNVLVKNDENYWKYPYWLSVLEEVEKNFENSLKFLQHAYTLDSNEIDI